MLVTRKPRVPNDKNIDYLISFQ